MRLEVAEYIAVLQRLLQIKEGRGWLELSFASNFDQKALIEVQVIVTKWCDGNRTGKQICDLVDKEVEFLMGCEDVVRIFDFHRDCNCIEFELRVNKQG